MRKLEKGEIITINGKRAKVISSSFYGNTLSVSGEWLPAEVEKAEQTPDIQADQTQQFEMFEYMDTADIKLAGSTHFIHGGRLIPFKENIIDGSDTLSVMHQYRKIDQPEWVSCGREDAEEFRHHNWFDDEWKPIDYIDDYHGEPSQYRKRADKREPEAISVSDGSCKNPLYNKNKPESLNPHGEGKGLLAEVMELAMQDLRHACERIKKLEGTSAEFVRRNEALSEPIRELIEENKKLYSALEAERVSKMDGLWMNGKFVLQSTIEERLSKADSLRSEVERLKAERDRLREALGKALKAMNDGHPHNMMGQRDKSYIIDKAIKELSALQGKEDSP